MSGYNPNGGVPNEVTWRQRAKQRAAAAANSGNDVEMQAVKPLARNQPMAAKAVQVASHYTASGMIADGKKTLAEQLGLKLKPEPVVEPPAEPATEPVVEPVQAAEPEPTAIETQPPVQPVVEPSTPAVQSPSSASDDLL